MPFHNMMLWPAIRSTAIPLQVRQSFALVEVDDGVYMGSKPKTDADFRFLHSKNVKTIVDLQFVPALYRREKEAAEKYEIRVITVTIGSQTVGGAPDENVFTMSRTGGMGVKSAPCLKSKRRFRMKGQNRFIFRIGLAALLAQPRFAFVRKPKLCQQPSFEKP